MVTADEFRSAGQDAIDSSRQLGQEAEVHRVRARALRDAARDLAGLVHELDAEAAEAEVRADQVEVEKRRRRRELLRSQPATTTREQPMTTEQPPRRPTAAELRSMLFYDHGQHVYLSTGCLHGDGHDYCSNMYGMQGQKRPGKCKFCNAQCICECHGENPTGD